jgi:hypothetical protein
MLRYCENIECLHACSSSCWCCSYMTDTNCVTAPPAIYMPDPSQEKPMELAALSIVHAAQITAWQGMVCATALPAPQVRGDLCFASFCVIACSQLACVHHAWTEAWPLAN